MQPIRAQLEKRIGAATMCCAIALLTCAFQTSSARADFQACNGTSGRVGIAIGYKDAEGNWVTEGWWNLPPHACEVPLKGALTARYYYVYAIDYDNGGEWAGSAFMCTREKEFKIVGIDDCLGRGYDRTGFNEIDTGQQRSWTIQFTDTPSQQGAPAQGMPIMPSFSGRPNAPSGTAPGNQNR